MKRITKCLLPMAVLAVSHGLSAQGATDAERIETLEAQLQQQKAMMEQQQRMLQSMEAELQRLKAGEPGPTGQVEDVEIAAGEKDMPAIAATEKQQGRALAPLSAKKIASWAGASTPVAA